MSNDFVKIKMRYVYNQWYDISCATLYIEFFTFRLTKPACCKNVNIRCFKIPVDVASLTRISSGCAHVNQRMYLLILRSTKGLSNVSTLMTFFFLSNVTIFKHATSSFHFPQPLPKRVLHTVRASAFCFNF